MSVNKKLLRRKKKITKKEQKYKESLKYFLQDWPETSLSLFQK